MRSSVLRASECHLTSVIFLILAMERSGRQVPKGDPTGEMIRELEVTSCSMA